MSEPSDERVEAIRREYQHLSGTGFKSKAMADLFAALDAATARAERAEADVAAALEAGDRLYQAVSRFRGASNAAEHNQRRIAMFMEFERYWDTTNYANRRVPWLLDSAALTAAAEEGSDDAT